MRESIRFYLRSGKHPFQKWCNRDHHYRRSWKIYRSSQYRTVQK